MRDKKDKSEVVVHENGRDSVSEAFRIVRTNMDFMRVKDKKMQVVMFTSFNPGAGKTFVSINLAMSFALTHKKVVLVDLDIRKGTLSSHVRVSDKGVTNYLSGRIDNVDEIIRQNELCDKLDIIHAGPVPPNPAELLLGDRLETLIAELRKRYDYIILDNVPAGVVADAVIVNRVADLTIYVVRAGRMDRRALPEVEKLYQEGKLRNMSLILNGTVYKHGAYGYRYGYGYGYSYGYGHSHLLPGVDDGVQSADDMQAALNAMQAAGVERVFLTPHVMADLPDNRRSYLQDRFACMKQFAPEGIELRLAAEYMLDAGFRLQMADGLLTYEDRQVLVETSYLSPPPDYLNLLYELSLEVYTPVLAHPERYMYMTKEDYFRLKDKGYKFQLNLFSLAGVYGARPAKYAAYLMKEGFYDYAGSDLHHPDDYKRNLARLKLSGKMLDGLREVLENNKGL